jgi:hypothetical protein
MERCSRRATVRKRRSSGAPVDGDAAGQEAGPDDRRVVVDAGDVVDLDPVEAGRPARCGERDADH